MNTQSSSKIRSQPTLVGQLLRMLLLLTLLQPLNTLDAHTPYAQWDAYRERHLQILTARSDLVGDAIADEWVAILAEHLPKSKAVVSRARNMIRVASLLKTDQAKVAVLSYEDAKAMSDGSAPFEEYGPMALQVLVDNGAYLLVTRSDLPKDHGFLVVSTLLEQGTDLNLSVPSNELFGIDVHSGASFAVAEH